MPLPLRRFPARGGLQLFALLCAMMAGTSSIHAVTITVTTTADSGAGSLRAALAAASDGDTIQFDPALNGQSITLTTAELAIDKNITIDGPGADQLAVTKSSATPDFRIFHVLPGHTVTIEGLTISEGRGFFGGGLLNDHATLTLNNCAVKNNRAGTCAGVNNDARDGSATLNVFNTTVSGNIADAGTNSAYGGGICNIDAGATLTITNSTVSGNVSTSAGGIGCLGGGIYNGDLLSEMFPQGGTVTITNSIVSNNRVGPASGPSGGYGGGIWNRGSISITNSTISGNTAAINGGGIYQWGPSGTMTIDSSTVSANSVIGISQGEPVGWGGGIVGYQMTITNSTISGNSSNRSGGGVGHGVFTKITNSTISGNTAPLGGGIASSPGASCSSCRLQIGNTILNAGAEGANIFMFNNTGTVTSLGFNLSSDDGNGVLTLASDRHNTDPKLGPLQNNGGPTLTHNLLIGSPALDAGDPNFTPPPLYDQRGPGYDRVVNGRIDVGALEVQGETPTPSPTPTATATAPPPATPIPTSTPTATPTPTPTATATASPAPTATPGPTIPAQSLNLSSRMLVQTGDRVGIAGLIITGTAPKRVIVRVVHCQVCIPEIHPLMDPVLELHGPNGFATIINNNWRDTQEAEIIATGLAPDNNTDPAIVVTLAPGNYTAIARGNGNLTGVAVIEVYDLDHAAASRLANISTRAFIATEGNVLIGGFILGHGTSPDNVIVRGLGPSLTGLGVPDALADPRMELHDSHGALVRSNDNWMDDPAQAALIIAAGLAPANPLESAIAETLPPGQYTAVLYGVDKGTGNGLVEIYDRVGQP